MSAAVNTSIPIYRPTSIILDGPAIISITIYAIPQIAIHQNCIIVRIKRNWTVPYSFLPGLPNTTILESSEKLITLIPYSLLALSPYSM